jgi:hypothetical protein
VYLSLESQQKLPFSIVNLTPKNSFCRKNIGYLFAMSQGAEVIFDLDDDNVPVPVKVNSTNTTILPFFNQTRLFNRSLLYAEDQHRVCKKLKRQQYEQMKARIMGTHVLAVLMIT